MLVHRKVTPIIMIADIHLYTWVYRENMELKVPCQKKQHDGRDLA